MNSILSDKTNEPHLCVALNHAVFDEVVCVPVPDGDAVITVVTKDAAFREAVCHSPAEEETLAITCTRNAWPVREGKGHVCINAYSTVQTIHSRREKLNCAVVI